LTHYAAHTFHKCILPRCVDEMNGGGGGQERMKLLFQKRCKIFCWMASLLWVDL